MKRDARHVRGIVDGLLSRIGAGAKKHGAVSGAWAEAAGEEAKTHARAVSIKGGILLVAVQDSVWLYRMMLDKKELLRKFNEKYTGRKKATDIRFRIGAAEFS